MSSSAAETFLDHFGLLPDRPDRDQLCAVGEAFAQLPYENLTKLIRKHTATGVGRRRAPDAVIADHLALGTGGTCFALVELFGAVLDRLGYRSHPVACETSQGAESHCALVIAGDEPLLMDPGYLLHQPLPLRPGRGHTETLRVGEVVLEEHEDGFEVWTQGKRRYRVRPEPLTRERFCALWDASFEWTMMDNVHLSRALDDGYAYVHGDKLRLQRSAGKETLSIKHHRQDILAERFGIAIPVIRRAYELVAAARDSSA